LTIMDIGVIAAVILVLAVAVGTAINSKKE
jgi:hypothetical protein